MRASTAIAVMDNGKCSCARMCMSALVFACGERGEREGGEHLVKSLDIKRGFMTGRTRYLLMVSVPFTGPFATGLH